MTNEEKAKALAADILAQRPEWGHTPCHLCNDSGWLEDPHHGHAFACHCGAAKRLGNPADHRGDRLRADRPNPGNTPKTPEKTSALEAANMVARTLQGLFKATPRSALPEKLLSAQALVEDIIDLTSTKA